MRVQSYLSTFQTAAEPRCNIYKHIPKEFVRKEKKKYLTFADTMERPARKQVETSLANNYTYKEGDEEYNFWFSKYICSKDEKDKEAALTKCNPELDVGYTAADLFNEKGAAYYCLFFARGCCSNGVNCRYYHKIPCIEDCECIEQTKDIFGRSRFSSFREDMKGVGSFAKETKALYVSEYRLPSNENGVTQMYEILLRHFSLWGELEDINILPHKGYAFIKYTHRCMAEFAKEAMTNQTLDANEMLTIKWANEDPNPRVTEVEENEERKLLLAALDKKRKDKDKDGKRKNLKEQRQKVVNSMMKNFRP
jgi:hypothetical protein